MSTEDTSAYGCFTRACMKWSEQRGSRRSSSDACGIDSKRQRTSRRQSCTHYTCEQRRTKLESAWPGEQAPGSASRRYSSSSRAGTAHGACQRPPFAFARTREKAMARESGLRSLGAACLLVEVLCHLQPPARSRSALGMPGRPPWPPSHYVCLRVRGGDDSSLFEVGSELDEPRKRRRDQPAAGASLMSTLRVYVCRLEHVRNQPYYFFPHVHVSTLRSILEAGIGRRLCCTR